MADITLPAAHRLAEATTKISLSGTEKLQAFPLQPRSLSGTFDAAFDLYRQHFTTFALLVAMLYLPIQMILHLTANLWLRPLAVQMSGATSPSPETVIQVVVGYALTGAPGSGFPGLLSLVALFLATGPVFAAVSLLVRGQPVSVGRVFRASIRSFPALLIGWSLPVLAFLCVACLVAITALFGLSLLLISVSSIAQDLPDAIGFLFVLVLTVLPYLCGFLPVSVFSCFTAPLLIEEKLSPINLYYRNLLLAGGKRFWRTWLGVLSLPLVIYGMQILMLNSIESVATASGFSAAWVFLINTAAVAFVNFVLQPYWMLCLSLLYFDYRTIREGFDIRLLAEKSGLTPPAAPQGVSIPVPEAAR